jgi:hypothetical protein
MLARSTRTHVGVVGRCAQIAAKYGEKRNAMEPFSRARAEQLLKKRNAMEPFRGCAAEQFKMN